MAAAVSSGRAKRRIGISDTIFSNTSSRVRPVFAEVLSMICSMRGVSVEPGSTLLTVMPFGASSVASVLAQLATAQRVVLDTPRPCSGSFTDVEMTLTVELGRTRLPLRDVLDLAPGAVLELDRAASSPADILVNGRLIARGEVVVVDEDYGVRITQIVSGQEGEA